MDFVYQLVNIDISLLEKNKHSALNRHLVLHDSFTKSYKNDRKGTDVKCLDWMVAVGACVVLSTAQAGGAWVMAVSEGTSGGIDSAQVLAKYGPLARVIEKATGHKVSVVLTREFSRLEQDMKAGKSHFVMARPSDYPARGVRDYGYQLVSTMNPEGHCYILVNKDSPLKTVQDLKGKRLLFPEKVSYMSKFCRAALRDQGIDVEKEKVTYMREQDAVAWSVEKGVADAGAVASYSAPGKRWEKSGGRILFQSVAQPYFPLIASKDVAPADIAKIQDAFRKLEQTDDGAETLSQIGVREFHMEDEKRLLGLLKWLEQ